MSYGRKTEVIIRESSKKLLERGPMIALHLKGRPYKIAKNLVNFLMERRYCMPGDVLLWAITYTRKEKCEKVVGGKIIVELEPSEKEEEGK